jgi:hypothetical protein
MTNLKFWKMRGKVVVQLRHREHIGAKWTRLTCTPDKGGLGASFGSVLIGSLQKTVFISSGAATMHKRLTG